MMVFKAQSSFARFFTIRFITTTVTSLLLAFFLLASHELQADPRISDKHIVMSTDYGDLVLALYPDVAPSHVQQILTLVKLGAYDSSYFFRVIPDFIVQLSDVNNRLRPMTVQQAAAVKPIKAEFSDTLKHQKGTLSMARWDDPNSATSSFSILLNAAPHLDGKYTIFGQLESGGSVINRILGIPRENDTPKRTIAVKKAYVIMDLAQYYQQHPFDPIEQIGTPIPMEEQLSYANRIDSTRALNFVAFLVMVIVATGVLGFFLYDKISKSRMLSLLLVNVLISGFILFIILIPSGHNNSWIAAAMFVAIFGMFRLMSNFESKKD